MNTPRRLLADPRTDPHLQGLLDAGRHVDPPPAAARQVWLALSAQLPLPPPPDTPPPATPPTPPAPTAPAAPTIPTTPAAPPPPIPLAEAAAKAGALPGAAKAGASAAAGATKAGALAGVAQTGALAGAAKAGSLALLVKPALLGALAMGSLLGGYSILTPSPAPETPGGSALPLVSSTTGSPRSVPRGSSAPNTTPDVASATTSASPTPATAPEASARNPLRGTTPGPGIPAVQDPTSRPADTAPEPAASAAPADPNAAVSPAPTASTEKEKAEEERKGRIREEARLVKAGREALAAGNTAGALQLLGQAQATGGVMHQESEALIIEALARGGQGDAASARARAFLAAHPTSPHATRLRSFVR